MFLNEEQIAIQDASRRYSERALFPFADAWDQSRSIPGDVVEGLAHLGLMGMFIPESYGGVAAGHLCNALAMEEIGAGCAGAATLLHVHNIGGSLPIVQFGTPEQKSRYLPAMAAGTSVGAFCLTEPQAGSDTSLIRTRAVRRGDRYLLNGVKQFISNGTRAGIFIVVAMTDPEKGKRGVTMFIVPGDAPGLKVTRVEEKMGQRCSDTTEIVFSDVEIALDQVLGQVDGGYRQALACLSDGRVSVAAASVGIARTACTLAIAYARQRVAFGSAIAGHQAVAFRLADMVSQTDIARQYAHHAARLLDAGRPCVVEASGAKLFASRMAERVCSDAVQIYGGAGYMQGSQVERLYRDALVCQIVEGTNDMQRLIIARGILGN